MLLIIALWSVGHSQEVFARTKNDELLTPKEDTKNYKALPLQKPYYELKLSLNEYSVLNSAIANGLNRYGGMIEFNLKMVKEINQITLILTFDKQWLSEAFEYWLSLKSVDVLQIINVDDLNTNSKLALKNIKSLSEKVVYAQKNPIWNLVSMSGIIKQESDNWFLYGDYGKYKIKGNKIAEIKKLKERRIIINGYIKTENEIEIKSFRKVKENTLELFVMSQCPFAKNAQISLFNFLEKFPEENKPILEIHYIFYKETNGKDYTYTSLQGIDEVNENMIQIVIRDRYPEYYFEYLKMRASSDESWEELAAKVNLNSKDIQKIKEIMKNQREELIQKEYNYATNIYQIYDASPTYVWESERKKNIRDVEIFKNLDYSTEECISN